MLVFKSLTKELKKTERELQILKNQREELIKRFRAISPARQKK